MRAQVDHRYVAEILTEAAAPLATVPLDELDWIPAIESAYFQQLRNGVVAPSSTLGEATIRPGWDGAAGAPYVSHLDVAFEAADARSDPIPLQYFAGPVQAAVSSLVAAGKVEEGQKYRWRVCAYHAPQAARATSSHEEPFRVEEAATPAPRPSPRSLPDLLARAHRCGPGPDADSQSDIPVFVAAHVLREAAAHAIAGGGHEAGGILLGRLARDPASGDLLVEVSAQVPAREAIADDASLRFAPQTWKAVNAAIRLRHLDEEIVGWYHSHPVALWPCRNCGPEARAICPSGGAFFSAMDVRFHRTVFQAAHNVALLLSFHADPQPRCDLFGWRRGLVAARGYHTIEERA